jgi:hypothetical protein
MSSEFHYKPKLGTDIRIKKPGKAKAATAVEEAPEGRACDHTGCKGKGLHRAPKSRDRQNEFWWFCAEHVADYNKRWNYFAGMSDGEMKEYMKKAEIGHRPTWTMRAGKGDRIAASTRALPKGAKADPFEMFGGPAEGRATEAPRRRISRVHAMALDTMQLEEGADSAAIRARYAELVKRWHPDSNGGDRSAEDQLRKVVQAYQTLKTGGFV